MSMGRRPMPLSHARVFAVRREIAARQASAVRASAAATDDRERAALRGKVHAYGEALALLAALDKGRILTRLFRTPKWRLEHADRSARLDAVEDQNRRLHVRLDERGVPQ